MLGRRNLKPAIEITATSVECPVLGCSERVERQRRTFRREARSRCPRHGIYISPTTFEYADERDNLLWKDAADTALLNAIKTVKRESRLARDNSEDALTWNVFRYLETTRQLTRLLSWLTQEDHRDVELVYWSYSQRSAGVWPPLERARVEFGERQRSGSEPDLIALSDKALFFIEAKQTATNDAAPGGTGHGTPYIAGGDRWWQQVFSSDFSTVAVDARKYELVRLWLLGTWLAHQLRRQFFLINVVPSGRETDIEHRFGVHIRNSSQRQFARLTWEAIAGLVVDEAPPGSEKDALVAYLENKTTGYDRLGRLQRAFQSAFSPRFTGTPS